MFPKKKDKTMVEIQSVPLAPQRASMSGRARLVVWWFAALVSVITLGAAHAAPERLGTAHPVPERSELTLGIGPGDWGTGGLAVIADNNGIRWEGHRLKPQP